MRASLLDKHAVFPKKIAIFRSKIAIFRSNITIFLVKINIFLAKITVLPGDANDAKLIDYGLRRKFAVDQTSTSPAVTVVDDDETPVTL